MRRLLVPLVVLVAGCGSTEGLSVAEQSLSVETLKLEWGPSGGGLDGIGHGHSYHLSGRETWWARGLRGDEQLEEVLPVARVEPLPEAREALARLRKAAPRR